MTVFTITWGRTLDSQQRTELIATQDLASGLRARFRRKVGRPWTRPIAVFTQTMHNAHRCGMFQIKGRRAIVGTWWATEHTPPGALITITELGDPA